MNRVRMLDAPRLNTNNAYSSFGQVLMNDAARGLNLNERKRRTNLYNAYKDKALNQRQSNADRSYNLQKNTFDFNKTKHQQSIDANAALVKTKYPNVTKNIGLEYGDYPSKENANSFHNVLGNIDIKHLENKSSYIPISTLNNDGTPTIKIFDRNSGSFKDTHFTPYVKPKQSSPEREAYYQARKEELHQKRINNMVKSLELQYPGIGEEERIKAINYINQNGQMPIIKNHKGWFGGNNFIVEMDNKQKQKTHKEIGKEIDKEINSINNLDVHEKRFYNRNSRDLLKAKEWSKNEGKKYISDLWFPNEKELLQRYFKYGKDKK